MWKYWRDLVPKLIIVLTSAAAGGFWFLSSQVPIPNDQDAIIKALQKASQWSAYAAISASIAAFFGVIQFWQEWEFTDSIRKRISNWFD